MSKQQTLSRRDLDHAITMIRVLIAAPLKESDHIKRIGIKHRLNKLKTAYTKLFNAETSEFKEQIDEERKIIVDEIKKELDEYEAEQKKSGEEFADRDSLQESILKDHPVGIKIENDWREFLSDDLSVKSEDVPFQAFDSFERPDGDTKLSVGEGYLTYDSGLAFDWLVKKGLIVITKQKQKQKNGDEGTAK